MYYFVILHYIAVEETFECVESILKIDGDFKILIVDNASPNNTGKLLEEKYDNNSDIKVILNSQNFGFSKGNNIGFQYAKENGATFIAMINNDTILEQISFIEIANEIYTRTECHVIGPDIYSTKSMSHQNPTQHTFKNLKELKKQVKSAKIFYWLTYLGLDQKIVKWKKAILGPSENQKFREGQSLDWQVAQENIKIHGSAMLFTKKYIEQFDGLYPETFLYSEEDILYAQAQKHNLKIVYEPSLKIIHKEDRTTNSINNSPRARRRFYYKHYLKSRKVLLNLIATNE